MSLFDSFRSLDRSWDDRALEHQSVRTVFVSLLLCLFILGADVSMTIYRAVRFHRVEWSDLVVFAVLGMISFRYARIIYRRLGP